MDLVSLILILSLVWTLIHVLHYLLCLPTSRTPLPTAYIRGRHFSSIHRSAFSSKFVLRYLHLRFETSSWNASYDSLAVALSKRRNFWSRRFKFFYNVGSVLCVLGMLGSVAIMFLTFWQLSFAVSNEWWHGLFSQNLKTLVNRSLETETEIVTPEGSNNPISPLLKPIIPGITVPWSHLPPALTAVFVAQTIHEIGHAVCAALESVPVLSVGASLLVFLPSTFVKLSSTAVDTLMPAGRLRVISAGSFHNLVSWILLIVLGKSGLEMAFWSITYDNISSMGRAVISVEPHSSLYGHLPIGSLITMLDDTALNFTERTTDSWIPFTTENGTWPANDRGWCVEKLRFLEMPEYCCMNELDTTEPSHLSCFTPFNSKSPKRCLDPVQVMATNNRCSSVSECTDEHACVRPQHPRQLLRIFFQSPPWSRTKVRTNDEVIIWKGPQHEFAEEVQMGLLLPRFNLLPLWLPSTAQLFVEYLKLASISLYLFNLLPLPLLDGGKMLDVLLALAFRSTGMHNVDLEAARRLNVEEERSKRTSRSIQLSTGTLLGITIFLACFHVVRSKTYF